MTTWCWSSNELGCKSSQLPLLPSVHLSPWRLEKCTQLLKVYFIVLLYFILLIICVYRTRTSWRERTAPRHVSFQLKSCRLMFGFSNGLRVNRAWGEIQGVEDLPGASWNESTRLVSLLFCCSTCNSSAEARSTCDNIVDNAHASWCPLQHPTAPTSTKIRRHLKWLLWAHPTTSFAPLAWLPHCFPPASVIILVAATPGQMWHHKYFLWLPWAIVSSRSLFLMLAKSQPMRCGCKFVQVSQLLLINIEII